MKLERQDMSLSNDPFGEVIDFTSSLSSEESLSDPFGEVYDFEEKTDEKVIPRAIKGAVKGPGVFGDLLAITGYETPKSLPGKEVRTQLEAKASPEELIGLSDSDDILPEFGGLPTTQDLGKFAEMFGLPKGEAETFMGKAAEFGGEFLTGNILTGPIGRGANIFTKIFKPFVNAFVPGAALAGAQILDLPPWAQALSTIVTSIFTHKATGKNLRQYNSETYKKAFDVLPENAMGSTNKLGNKLDVLKNELKKGGEAPSEKAVLTAINQVESKIKNGQIPIDNATALKRSFNEYIIADEVRKQPRARNLFKSINSSLDEIIEDYGKTQNPKFLKFYREANSAHKGLNENRMIERFIKSHPVASTVGSHLVYALLDIPFSTLGGGAAVLKGTELLSAFARNKGLRSLYGKVLKDASKENVSSMTKSIKTLEKEFKNKEPDLYEEYKDSLSP